MNACVEDEETETWTDHKLVNVCLEMRQKTKDNEKSTDERTECNNDSCMVPIARTNLQMAKDLTKELEEL